MALKRLLSVCLLAGGLIVLLVACGPMTFVVGVSPGDQRLKETVVQADSRFVRDRVAIIDVSGLITNSYRGRLLQRGEHPVSLLAERLELARRDPRVKAVILRLNTPGGTVTASDAMFREVQRFRRQTGKPVVALMMDVTASGGYYLACASDQIVTYPTSVTGSVGVILQTVSIQPGLTRIGVITDAIVSGPHKDAGSPLSTLRPEQRQVLQSMVDDFYQRFVDVVRQARPNIDPDRFASLTDGRIMSGQAAVEAGLADRIGDLHDAFAAARNLAGIERAHLVIYHRPLDYIGSPYAAMPGATAHGGTQINLAQINLDGQLPGMMDMPVGFYYLWHPQQP